MSSIKLKNIKQTVIGSTTQPLTIGGILEDGSDAKISIDTSGNLTASNLTATLNGLLTTNGQIKFPATQNPSADANTLDDYEEGTWTPVFRGDLVAGTVTYTRQYGYYVKIGKIVHVNCDVEWTNITGASGEPQITGLPFPIANVAFNYPIASIFTINYPKLADSVFVSFGLLNTSTIGIWQTTGAAGTWNALTIDTSATVRLSLTYQTTN